MAAFYRERLTRGRLVQLPEGPAFIFCASDLNFGVNWIFGQDRIGSYRAGYVDPATSDRDWFIAQAVAASSCFPPIFRPMRLRFREGELKGASNKSRCYRELSSEIRLSDGGVYDNLGLQPALSAKANVLLVSNGGGPFVRTVPRTLIGELLRYQSILQGQVGALRKRQLIAAYKRDEFEGAYWDIASPPARYTRCAGEPPVGEGYTKKLAEAHISRIRTDLDGFSSGEMAVLENHGYTLAEAAVRCHANHLASSTAPPPRIPHPAYLDEQKAEAALRGSDKRKLFDRFPVHISSAWRGR